jgi:hypothetical protein
VRVNAVEVVSFGVTPVLITIFGLIAPEAIMLLETPVPIEAWVAVSDPPVAVGKVISATGEALLAETDQPEPERATVTRAYDV